MTAQKKAQIGRPAKSPEMKQHQRSIRLTASEWVLVEAGAAELRRSQAWIVSECVRASLSTVIAQDRAALSQYLRPECVAQTDQEQPESRTNTDLEGVAQSCPEGGANWSHPEPLQWVHEDDLAKLISDDTYNALFPYSKVDFVRMFPIFGPPAKSDAPPSASPWIWTGDVPPPGQAVIEYWGAGEYQVSTNWDGAPSWYMLIPAVPNENEGPEVAAVPVPPADKAGVSGSEASVSDKPACGAQSSECERQLAQQAAGNKLPQLNDDLIAILGRPNFACAGIAQLLRAGGVDIAKRSENEQAAVIHFLLGHYMSDPIGWADNVSAAFDTILASSAQQEGQP